ncbi:MAG TPA: glycosyltransferase family 4 protein [Anaerolineales bacterium]|nr:glycosyltransferase family 4 protein [Anaerolineales bacterium]HRQ92646.1 glycosyltransferase family 4 protein [Anaerolineales bacterium]
MRVALIEPGTLPAQTANSIQRMKMAQALVATGNTVRVFAPGAHPGVSWPEFANHYGLQHEFELEWVPNLPVLRKYDFAIHVLQRARAWGADVLYSRSPQAATWAAVHGLPSIFELHDIPMGFMGPWLLRRFLAASGARRLVANTQFLADTITANYSVPAREGFLLMAPNGVDLERYADLPAPANARQQLGILEGFTVGYTGHLYPGRGLETILELAAALPDIRFLLVGGKPADVEAARQRAASLPNVTLTGFVPNGELPLYQAAADVLIMPYGQQVSGSSGGDIAPYLNPMKMFEYLACARPIVTSDLPILREILDDSNAIILPGQDNAAWVGALRALAGDVARRTTLSAAARRTAEQYTWQQRAHRLLAGLR